MHRVLNMFVAQKPPSASAQQAFHNLEMAINASLAALVKACVWRLRSQYAFAKYRPPMVSLFNQLESQQLGVVLNTCRPSNALAEPRRVGTWCVFTCSHYES